MKLVKGAYVEDNYTLGDEIESGTYGRVLIAKNNDTVYAVKKFKLIGKLNPVDLLEIKAIDACKCENVISIVETYINRDELGMWHMCSVMPYYGATLRSWTLDMMKKSVSAYCGPAKFILGGIVRGVYTIHAAGFLHLDLKPENILIDAGNERYPIVKIIDFGLCKYVGNIERGIEHMHTTSRWYRAPEVMNRGALNHKTDIWGIGCMAYEIYWRGKVLFRGKTGVEQAKMVREWCEKPTSLKCGVAGFEMMERVCEGAIVLEPANRCNISDICEWMGIPVVDVFKLNKAHLRQKSLGGFIAAGGGVVARAHIINWIIDVAATNGFDANVCCLAIQLMDVNHIYEAVYDKKAIIPFIICAEQIYNKGHESMSAWLVVLEETLGLTRDEQLEIVWNCVDLVEFVDITILSNYGPGEAGLPADASDTYCGIAMAVYYNKGYMKYSIDELACGIGVFIEANMNIVNPSAVVLFIGQCLEMISELRQGGIEVSFLKHYPMCEKYLEM